jgi:hypothetical protein
LPGSKYDKLVAELGACGNNCRCTQIQLLLESAGFVVKARDAGHRTFSHPNIAGFFGGNYNCGHGANPQVSGRYVANILKTVRSIESELRAHLGEIDND